ncbi:MAG: hypothetical protein REJ50_24280 [Bordetella sp.]|nr:hypothetical protein [Bordetella sp.]
MALKNDAHSAEDGMYYVECVVQLGGISTAGMVADLHGITEEELRTRCRAYTSTRHLEDAGPDAMPIWLWAMKHTP